MSMAYSKENGGSMQVSGGLTIALDSETAKKLYELAGSPEAAVSYLTEAIARLYEKRLLLGEDVTRERLIYLRENRAEQIEVYRENVQVLKERLKKMVMTQEELLATVEQLRDATATLKKAAKIRLLN